MTTETSATPKQIRDSFDALFNSISKEEVFEQEARLLAFQFLSEVERVMEDKQMSKKALADKVGTSGSFITQLFRGDRLPNFTILAKIQQALEMKFEVKAKEMNSYTAKPEFEFPELETNGFLGFYKNLKPNYGKITSGDLHAEYNEAEAA